MHGKSNMETYITMCKIDGQWEFAVWQRKLKQRFCINLEEWDGEGDERKGKKKKKTTNRVAIWSSNPTTGHISRKMYFKIYMHLYVYSSTIHNSQDMEGTY